MPIMVGQVQLHWFPACGIGDGVLDDQLKHPITGLDILAIVNAKKANCAGQACNEFGRIRRLFKWALARR
jgi:hypothetical protein